jgi:iron complex outermembrane receptor protein
MRMLSFVVRSALASSLVCLVCAGQASAQSARGVTLRGHLVHAVTGEPVGDAVVVIEELRREAQSGADGAYSFESVAPGRYHLAVRAAGYSSRRTEVAVDTSPVTFDVKVDPELHYTEVVSVSPDARSAFEAYQPTSVLAGQDLAKQLQGSLGAVLAAETGVAERSLGPAPSRPVIRGLDGDRVLILEDGQRTGDLSSQSGDHGVSVNPAAATRIEVVRGPATLLYGANAIGGLVNVISDRIPTRAVQGTHGSFTLDAGSGAREGGGAGDFTWGNGSVAVHASGAGRKSGDVRTPDGIVDNSQSRSGEASFGASWTGARAYFGGSYGFDDTKYGTPVVEEGTIQLTPRRQHFSLRSGGQGFGGPFESYRATLGYRHYRHDELEGTEVGTQFRNDTTEVELLGGHKRYGRLTGTLGASAMARSFEAVGEEALSPPVDQKGAAAFVYEELTWPHVTLQFGGRFDHAGFSPQGGLPSRDFDNVSGSVGVLLRPKATHDAIHVAFSLARAARNPALEELYFFGPHAGNFAFEIANASLGSEKALGLDASLRWQTRRFSGELTFFRNDISDYIFREPVDEATFLAEYGDVVDEAPEFPVIRYTAADSVLQGVELHGDVQIAARLFGEFGFDYVRGTLSGSDEPLPRIPPFRFRGGLRYQVNAFQAGGEVVAAASQDRVFGDETTTDGYSVLKLYTAYSFQASGALNTITARLDNAANELYRNHLSLIKDYVPEMGRSLKVVYGVKF